jgi:hypothetical protein
MVSDDRNSIHLYKYNSKKSEIIYHGGEDTGRNVIDCGWVSEGIYYVLDDKN